MKSAMSGDNSKHYAYLSDLMGYFDQDYDIYGDLPDIVARYARVHHAVDVWATVADIRRFLQWKSDDVDGAFERIFKPGVVIASWNKTVPEWLLWVEQLLLEHAPALPGGDNDPRRLQGSGAGSVL